MTGCKRSCLHRHFVGEYRTARLAGEMARDDAVGAYGAEEWASYPPPITFKEWLKQMRGPE